MSSEGIRLYRTLPHPCGYFSDRQSQNLVLDPEAPQLAAAFAHALAQGYRRAGNVVYRPDCGNCQACVPFRIPIASFRADRAQRRTRQRNLDLEARWTGTENLAATYPLYLRYLAGRHAGGGMDGASEIEQIRFLCSTWTDTRCLELRLGDELVCVAVTDFSTNSASAVYTYYAPEHSRRSLGSEAILRQIDHCRELGLRHLYLGFWIAGHPKMHYKQAFGPAEIFVDRRWRAFETSAPIQA